MIYRDLDQSGVDRSIGWGHEILTGSISGRKLKIIVCRYMIS